MKKFKTKNLKLKVTLLVCLFLGPVICAPLFAQDISFSAEVSPRTVSLGSGIELRLKFLGTKRVGQPQLPQIEGFNHSYIGPSTNISIVNGQVSSSITHIYRLLPLKVGDLLVPSLSVEFKGKIYRSESVSIKVTPGSGSQLEDQDYSQRSDAATLEERVYLRLDTDKKIAYVNEIIPITIKLYVNDLNIRYNVYPELTHKGFLIDNLSEPRQYRESVGGLSFQVLEFSANAFALRPGELVLGPATFDCILRIKKQTRRRPTGFDDFDSFFGSSSFDGFFGGYERYPLRLKTPEVALVVKDLPSQNKPDDFNGALGDYSFKMEVQPREVREGDPVTLKMIIGGTGNLKTVNQPDLDFGEHFKVYDPEVSQTLGSKIFEQVIIPKNAKISEIPKISFSFFNPSRDEYQTIAQGPIPIKVIEVEDKETKVVEGIYPQRDFSDEVIGRDLIYIKEKPGKLRNRGSFLYKNKLFLFFQILPLIVLISVLSYFKESQRLKNDVRYARRLMAPQKAKKAIASAQRLLGSGGEQLFGESSGGLFFDTVFKTLRDYLGDRLHLPSAGITADSVTGLLKNKGADLSIIDKINYIFSQCDMVRFSPARIDRENMKKVFDYLQETIDYLERKKL